MRARNIKPGFYKNEVLAQCNPFARILFSGLWCLADKDGRLEDRPMRIKAEVLPFDELDVDALLNQLYAAGFIIRYEVDKSRFLQVVKFGVHQHAHRDERSYDFPSPYGENAKSLEIPGDFASKLPSLLNPSHLNPSFLKDRLAPSREDAASEPTPRPDSPAAMDGPQKSQGQARASAQPAADDPAVLTFPVSGGKAKEWSLCASKLAEYRESFPGLDVLAEFRVALQWCRDNAAKRKTPNGMTRFLTRWLARAQNSGRAQGARSTSAGMVRPTETVAEKIARLQGANQCPSPDTPSGQASTQRPSGSTGTATSP